MKLPQSFKKKARIEIIPLIDVVFFLLATFVLFTLSLQKTLVIPLQLPVAVATSNNLNPEKPVEVTVTDQNLVIWNDNGAVTGPMELDLFLVKLGQYKRDNSNPRIMIKANDHAGYGTLIKVLDDVRKIGITQVTFQTRPA